MTYLLSLIEAEKAKGIEVIIGGYSQGLAIAQLAFLTGGLRVDGLAVLRGWVARNEHIRQVGFA